MLNSIDNIHHIDESNASRRASRHGRTMHVLDEPSDNCSKIVCLPISFYVGFSKADVSIQGAALEELLTSHNSNLRRDLSIGGTEVMRATIRKGHTEAAIIKTTKAFQHELFIKTALGNDTRLAFRFCFVEGEGGVHGFVAMEGCGR